jgi:septal ring factor EnvC (AmiA/AmiB activator)
MTPQEAVAVAGGAVGAVGAIVAWRKTRAEHDNLAVDTMRDVLEEVRREMDRERADRSRCEQRLLTMESELKVLRSALIRAEVTLSVTTRKVGLLERWMRAQGANPEDVEGYPV